MMFRYIVPLKRSLVDVNSFNEIQAKISPHHYTISLACTALPTNAENVVPCINMMNEESSNFFFLLSYLALSSSGYWRHSICVYLFINLLFLKSLTQLDYSWQFQIHSLLYSSDQGIRGNWKITKLMSDTLVCSVSIPGWPGNVVYSILCLLNCWIFRWCSKNNVGLISIELMELIEYLRAGLFF